MRQFESTSNNRREKLTATPEMPVHDETCCVQEQQPGPVSHSINSKNK